MSTTHLISILRGYPYIQY